jgi:glyoxylase-like metal-dependent hydrolase (beta-lactamase superfamily II)
MLATVALGACRVDGQANSGDAAEANAASPEADLSLTRLDCGYAEFKEMDKFFSDRPGVYPPGPGRVANSCYLIRHGDEAMIWDTGFAAETKDKPLVREVMTAGLTRTLAEQLQQLGVSPEDVDVVGISHMHGDHIGQAAQFANARLVIGRQDFELLGKEPDDTLKAWRGSGKNVSLATGDVDIFGDGSVVALHMPGHTPDHLALLVNLASGPVLLSGDLYHSTISREKRSAPPFNTSKEQTLASMDKFEALAKERNANVVIQHEAGDIGKLPAFPQAAK